MYKALPESSRNLYTTPVSGLLNLTELKTRKDTHYETFKGRTEVQFSELNIHGLCKGNRHQVQKQLISTQVLVF